MKYRKRPIVIEAARWWRMGDHPAVVIFDPYSDIELWHTCDSCKGVRHTEHGHIKTLEGVMLVCPGDYIITGVEGEVYACKPDIFAATYEAVSE